MSNTDSDDAAHKRLRIPKYELFGITADQRMPLAQAVTLRLHGTTLSKRPVKSLFRRLESDYMFDGHEAANWYARDHNLSFVEQLALHTDTSLYNIQNRAHWLRDNDGKPMGVYEFFLNFSRHCDYLPLEVLEEPIWPLKNSTWKTILESEDQFGWRSVFPFIVIGSLADISDNPCPKINTARPTPEPEEAEKTTHERPAPEDPTASDRPRRPKDLFAEAADSLQEKAGVLNRFIDRLQEIGRDDELRSNLITIMNPDNRAFHVHPDYYDAATENLNRNGVFGNVICRILELSSNEGFRKNILTIITPNPNWTYSNE